MTVFENLMIALARSTIRVRRQLSLMDTPELRRQPDEFSTVRFRDHKDSTVSAREAQLLDIAMAVVGESPHTSLG